MAEQTTITTDCTGNGTIERSTFESSAVMACKRKEIFFSSTSCFYYYYYSLLFFLFRELLQGLLTTWLQAQKNTRVHNPNANLKTHVQGKQIYVGLHHLVQFLYCNQTLCVCVCVCVCMFPRPKVGSKTSFGTTRSFLLLKLWNSKLHSL
jgi:hypothetical protein